MQKIRNKTINGFLWNSFERIFYYLIQAVTTIWLARYITPNEFGVIAISFVFISISSMLSDSGLGGALIIKKDTTSIDYSTIFTINLSFSLFLYLILFIISKEIANYYDNNILILIIRISGISIILNGLNIVRISYLLKTMQHKAYTKIIMVSTFTSSILTIILAVLGFGIWALVFNQLMLPLLTFILLKIFVDINPEISFSKKSFNELFGIGYKLTLSSLLDAIFINIYSLIIGKVFAINSLGLYYQARKIQEIPINSTRTILDRVSFPLLARIDDSEEFKHMAKKIFRYVLLIILPIMLLFSLCSENIISILFEDQWINAANLLSILCYVGIWQVVDKVNKNMIKALGQTTILLKAEIIKKCLLAVIIYCSIQFNNMEIFLWGVVLGSFVSSIINMFFLSKISEYSIYEQSSDMIKILGISMITFLIAYFTKNYFALFQINNILTLLLTTCMFFFILICLLFIFKFNEISEVIFFIKKGIKKDICQK